uniref:Uncharacterized protein n=1 Tax=Panagrolaimus sp. PS1159 TaxID=55785 RepID=A0AC35GQ46_9BILA
MDRIEIKIVKARAITNSIQTNAILIGGNSKHTCIPNLQSNIPMPTTPTSIPYYSDPTAAAYDAPPLTNSVSTAATPSVSSHAYSNDPSMIKDQVFAGNLNEVCVSREMLCNENSPILCDSTDAHEMSKDYCNGEIVDVNNSGKSGEGAILKILKISKSGDVKQSINAKKIKNKMN